MKQIFVPDGYHRQGPKGADVTMGGGENKIYDSSLKNQAKSREKQGIEEK